MDKDETLEISISLHGYRGSYFVVNFSNGEDVVFQATDNRMVSFPISGASIIAFRESDSFRLYEEHSGFIGSPFSLKGSSRTLDDLLLCVRSL